MPLCINIDHEIAFHYFKRLGVVKAQLVRKCLEIAPLLPVVKRLSRILFRIIEVIHVRECEG